MVALTDASRSLLQRLLDLLGLERLEHVVDLDVLEALEHDAAFEAGLDLLDVVLEAAQRADPARPGDGAVADEPDLGAARESTFADAARRRSSRPSKP